MKKLLSIVIALMAVTASVLFAACGETSVPEATVPGNTESESIAISLPDTTPAAETEKATDATESPATNTVEQAPKAVVPEGFDVSETPIRPYDADGNFQLNGIKLESVEYEVYCALAKLAVAARTADIYYEEATAKIRRHMENSAQTNDIFVEISEIYKDIYSQYIPEFSEIRDDAYMTAAAPLISELTELLSAFNTEKYEGYDDIYAKYNEIYKKNYYQSGNFNLFYRNSWFELAFADAASSIGEQCEKLLAVENADTLFGAETIALISDMQKDLYDLKKVIAEYKYYSESPEFFVSDPTGIVCEWDEENKEVVISVYSDADIIVVSDSWGIYNKYGQGRYGNLTNPAFYPIDGKAEICRISYTMFKKIANGQCSVVTYLGETLPYEDFHIVSYGPYNCRTQPYGLEIDSSWLEKIDYPDTPYKAEDPRIDALYRAMFGGDYTLKQIANIDSMYILSKPVGGVNYLDNIRCEMHVDGKVKQFVYNYEAGTPMFEDLTEIPLDKCETYICVNFYSGEVYSSDLIRQMSESEIYRRHQIYILGAKDGNAFRCLISPEGIITVTAGEL